MTYNELLAVERFAKKLQETLPYPQDNIEFADKILIMAYEHFTAIIYLTLEKFKLEWELEAGKEFQYFQKGADNERNG
jgi:hypothetical protein